MHEIIRLLRDGKKDAAMILADAQPKPASGCWWRRWNIGGVRGAGGRGDANPCSSTQPCWSGFHPGRLTAATAPLLGLLGTVTGIIKTFKLMEVFGAGDPKPLISGISEALITTELGLVLAIPALIAHALLSRRVAGVLARLEKLSIAFVNGLSRKPVGTVHLNKSKAANAD